MTPVDASQRAAAIDVRNSFCVTAPAGSGKTELLIQRYLALLSRVDRPEQVLAITFTRKAAAEMRERVLQALAEANACLPCESDHQIVTRELANAALQHGAARGWNLGRDIARLNIRTIDGYCSALTRQMPVLSRFGGQAEPVDDATLLYEEAVSELFELLGSRRSEAEDLRVLLLHFDNNWERLSQLLVSMLSKRDQWQDYLGAQHSPDEAEMRLRHFVTVVIEESLQRVHAALTPRSGELLALLRYAQGNLGETLLKQFPRPTAEDLADWCRLRSLLLTSAGTFRKRLSIKEGFVAGKGEPQACKTRFFELVAELAEIPELEVALRNITSLPEMTEHTAAWQLVVHLSHVLPLLSACLLVVFARRGVVDHTQVALSALDALGEDDAPTDLALRLDYAIEHILVDEFQDTAINQYKLVSRLTRGWGEYNAASPEAPRTVFIVGDGMQSIYGFRNANVGLFLTARQRGFNGVIPRHLALQCNFRSSRAIVDWVNDTFHAAFPAEDDIRRGRVSFSPATPVKPAGPEPAISLEAFQGERAHEQEADWVVAQVREGLADPSSPAIAILGRTRAQLAPIVQRLRSAGMGFAAEELDPLASSPAVVDLLTLCRALANPADRVAWFALLRAPWCGLSLADLQRLAGSGTRNRNIAGLLHAGAWPADLSPRGCTALQRLADCFAWIEQHRDRLALRVWVEQAWEMLGGPECLAEPRFLTDAGRFLALLEAAEDTGIGLDAEWLQRQVERLYAAGDDPGANVQVMTLHKAKGLEFDWVIIPSLARGARSDDRSLLLWDESVSPEGERGFLLAADDHSDTGSPTLYNYLKLQRREKARLENTRLLYVGATRAISRLFLSACLATEGGAEKGEPDKVKPPPEGALLHSIWPAFRSQMRLNPPVAAVVAKTEVAPPLWRAASLPAAPPANGALATAPNRPEEPQNRVDRIVGTVIHECLEHIAASPKLVQTLSPDRRAQLHLRLRELGLWGHALATAAERVERDVERTLSDEQGGRWILDPGHREARSEMPLTVLGDGKVQDIVIDRSFVDRESGIRWIIDYKSSLPAPGVDQAVFTTGEAERYRTQLRGYRDAMRALGTEPVRCALYFTGLALLYPLRELDD